MLAEIVELEESMRDLPKIDIPIMHYFANGLYAREMNVPAGTVLTGKIHREEHLSIISQGEITFVNESGPSKVSAPHTFVSQPGTKRAFYAHTDTVWTTIHATDETDIDTIEATLVVDRFDQLESSIIDKIGAV